MTSAFDDERIQFFLRHRDDIRAWAAIEPELTALVAEMLANSQPFVEERLAEIDPTIVVTRADDRGYRKIFASHPGWPEWRGVALEWQPGRVDPFGSSVPKVGFFWWSAAANPVPAKVTFMERCKAAGMEGLGYRIPADNAWPILRKQETSRDWWHDPDAWISQTVEQIVTLWGQVAQFADEAFLASPEMADG